MTKTPEQMAEEHANLRCPEQGPEFIVWCMCRDDFLAGYRAAKDQFAAAGKVVCNTTMEEIKDVDTGELMPITYSPSQSQWISVKDRLPEEGLMVLWLTGKEGQWDCGEGKVGCGNSWCRGSCGANFNAGVCYKGEWYFYKEQPRVMADHLGGELSLDYFSHWMPLPEPPREEK